MRILFSLATFLFCSVALAQSSAFIGMENKIKDLVARGQWDEVILLAPDLMIEEPSRGEGYYYTAVGFYRLGQYEKASGYVAKAESLADDGLRKKIDLLKTSISTGRKAVDMEKQALGEEQSGNNEKAADEWKRLWELDKSQVEYALNAVDLYIERKDYVAALQILNDPVLEKDAGARQLIARLNQTPKMRRINEYKEAMARGQASFNHEDYEGAIRRFDEALELFAGDTDAGQFKRKAQDELAWKQTVNTNTIQAFENYIAGNTLKQHKNEAVATIQRALIYHGESYAREDNIGQMEYYLNKYLKEYASGADAGKAKSILCSTYYRNGQKLAGVKNAYSQEKAIGYFKNIRSLCPSDYAIAKNLKTATRKLTRYRRPDRGYLAYLYDSLMPIGLSIGSVNNRKIGVYLSANMNSQFATKEAYYTVDNSGKLEGNVYDDIRFNNEKRTGQAEIIVGLTKKITYPLWIYAGGGISMRKEWWEMDTYSDNGTYYETEWVKNTDETGNSAIADAGVIIDLSGLHLRGGVRSTDLKAFRYSVGIGFSWK